MFHGPGSAQARAHLHALDHSLALQRPVLPRSCLRISDFYKHPGVRVSDGSGLLPEIKVRTEALRSALNPLRSRVFANDALDDPCVRAVSDTPNVQSCVFGFVAVVVGFLVIEEVDQITPFGFSILGHAVHCLSQTNRNDVLDFE